MTMLTDVFMFYVCNSDSDCDDSDDDGCDACIDEDDNYAGNDEADNDDADDDVADYDDGYGCDDDADYDWYYGSDCDCVGSHDDGCNSEQG